MAARNGSLIRQVWIANEGKKNEMRFDSAEEHPIYDEKMRQVDKTWIVGNYNQKTKHWRYGILNSSGKLTTPVKYRKLRPLKSQCYKWDRLYEVEDKHRKTGVIDADNNIIRPFTKEIIIPPIDMQIVEQTDLISFYIEVNEEQKYGLSKWPTAEIVYEAKWDNIKAFHRIVDGKLITYWQLEKHGKKGITKNLVKKNHEIMFDNSEKYFTFDYVPGRLINFGATGRTSCLDWGDTTRWFFGVDFDVFDQNGKVLFSEKAYDVEFPFGYKNVLIVDSPGGYESKGKGYAIVFWQNSKRKLVMEKIPIDNIFNRTEAFKNALKFVSKDIKAHIKKE